jgi:undecaprenyl-diphosphatase
MVSERHLRGAVGISLVVLAVTAVVARTSDVSAAERAVDRWFYDLPTWSSGLWRVVMQCGTAAGIAVVVAVLLLRPEWRGRPLVLAGPAVLLAWTLGQAGKRLVGRGRPTAVALHRPMRDVVDGNGYPSTHTVVAVGLAVALIAAIPMRWAWRVLLLALGAGTAIARMHVTAHWPLDVVGGAALAVAVVGTAALLTDPRRRVT